MAGKVKVFMFRLYDIAADEFKVSARMATEASIHSINAQLIGWTELEIDETELDADGMTGIGFSGPELSSQ